MSTAPASLHGARACYGVDVTGTTPILVRAERGHGRVNCTPVSPASATFEDDMAKGTPLAAALPAGESFARWLEAPFPRTGKAAKVFPTLLDIQLPFALEDCVYDFLDPAPTPEGTTRALAVAARIRTVELRLERLGEQHVDPLILDQEGLALWTQNLAEAPVNPNDQGGARAIVYLAADRATLVIGRGSNFLSAHSINPDDPAQINRLLQAQLAVKEPADDPARSANSTAATSGRTVAVTWYWTGPEAANTRLTSRIRKTLSDAWPGPAVTHDRPDTFLARAIATRALTAGPLRCNLRSGALTHEQLARRHSASQMTTALTYLLSGCFLIAAVLGTRGMAEFRARRLDAAVNELCVSLGGPSNAKGEYAIKSVRQTLDDERARLEPFLQVFRPSIATHVQEMTRIAEKHDIRYDELLIGREKILIRGTSGKWEDGERIHEYLKQAGYRATFERSNALADERIPFVVEGGPIR